MKQPTFHCSLGICVYNEEKNIARLLECILKQKLKNVTIDEIIVIASGTTDKTCEIVKHYQKKDARIKLYHQKKREGKASAVNLFIQSAKNEILALSGGDLLLTSTVIEKLVGKFQDPDIGMAGAHPVPLNRSSDGFSAFAGTLMWDLHHRLSLQRPKMGEFIAFRKIFKRISVTSGADEANIEPLILGQGYTIKYVPNAIVYNRAPSNIKDYIKQRRRNHWLHLALKEEQRYVVATMNYFLLIQVLFSYVKDNFSLKYVYIPVIVAIELYSRFLGWYDYYITKKRHTVWDIVESTKKLD